MVQTTSPLPPRQQFPAGKDNCASGEKSLVDSGQGDHSLNAQPIHPRSLTIEDALKNCVRLPIREFALAVVLQNGEEKMYTSQSLSHHRPKIFSDRFRQDFRQVTRRAAGDAPSPESAADDRESMDGQFDSETKADIRKQSSSEDYSSRRFGRRLQQNQAKSEESGEDDSASSKRKRRRGSLHSAKYSTNSNDDTPMPIVTQKTQQLKIGDESEVEKFYSVRFRDLQQSACKVLGKVFVKLVEPKKQTHHPYTKGNVKAPPWWPNTSGANHVRHKEPDHLLKPERILLLVHILRMIVLPYEKQCPTVQKLNLNVKKLEEVTMEAMSTWFCDKDHPENAQKKPFLKEIFKVARAQERYKNGEIDAMTVIPVMYGDRAKATSDDEPEEGLQHEDNDHDTCAAPAPPSTPASERLVSPPMLPIQHVQPQPETDSGSMFGSRLRPLPVRYHSHAPLEDHPSFTDPYLSNRHTGVTFRTPTPNLHDHNRRSYTSSYPSPPQNIYGWQSSSMVANGPVSASFYATTPPQSGIATQNTLYQLPPPITQPNVLPLPLTPHHYESRPYEAGPPMGSHLRTGHPVPMPHNHGFQEYLHDNGGYVSDPELKDEQNIHPG